MNVFRVCVSSGIYVLVLGDFVLGERPDRAFRQVSVLYKVVMSIV